MRQSANTRRHLQRCRDAKKAKEARRKNKVARDLVAQIHRKEFVVVDEEYLEKRKLANATRRKDKRARRKAAEARLAAKATEAILDAKAAPLKMAA